MLNCSLSLENKCNIEIIKRIKQKDMKAKIACGASGL